MISEGLEFCDDVEGAPPTGPLELLGYPIDSGSPRLWSPWGGRPRPQQALEFPGRPALGKWPFSECAVIRPEPSIARRKRR
jgi:hypothetical protein